MSNEILLIGLAVLVLVLITIFGIRFLKGAKTQPTEKIADKKEETTAPKAKEIPAPTQAKSAAMKPPTSTAETSSHLINVSQQPVGEVESSRSSYETSPKFKKVCLTCTGEFEDQVDRCPVDSTPLSRVLDESLIGVVFLDKYEIMEHLGSGGMSTVYRARHKHLNRDFAIKVMKGNTADSTDGLKRFQREARATGSVQHPGIVSVTDFGLTSDGRAFLVMEYIEGESLSSYLDYVGSMELPQTIDLAVQICDALTEAHNCGIVHRDLKPSNIMLVRGEGGRLQAKIVDFGLAKIVAEDSHMSMKITQTGDCFGSPLYMSPEQCMGKKVDHRCDIYALGCILFECLTGNPPIVGNNAAETITKHVKDKPAAFPDEIHVPKEIKLIIYKALHKEPLWRPQTVAEVKEALLACPLKK